MNRFLRFSYSVSEKIPLYPGTPPVKIDKLKDIKKGDVCNTFKLSFSNHAGTHIDAPRHFWEDGRRICDYLPKELIFNKPLIVNLPKKTNEIIEVSDLSASVHSNKHDAILIRTGFQKYRRTDTERYRFRNPFLSPTAAKWLRKYFPDLRVIGIDCISIASCSNRDLGKETHRILLKEKRPRKSAILIIEDLFIPTKVESLDKLIVLPLFVEGVDSAPCTVIGVIND